MGKPYPKLTWYTRGMLTINPDNCYNNDTYNNTPNKKHYTTEYSTRAVL